MWQTQLSPYFSTRCTDIEFFISYTLILVGKAAIVQASCGEDDMGLRAKAICFSVLVGLMGLTLQLGILRAMPFDETANQGSTDQRRSVKAATRWLIVEFQNDDGGFNLLSPGANQAPSTIPGTLDAILALAAGGYNSAAIFPGQENTPLDFLKGDSAGLAAFASANGGQAGKVVLALTAAAVDPRDFEGVNYLNVLNGHLQPTGAYDVSDSFKQAIAILGIAATGEVVPESAITWLAEKQADNGSWDDGFGTAANPDTTAMAIMALLSAGLDPNDPIIEAAVDFLASSQQRDGWEYGSGFGAGVNSTALVVQALTALGEDWYSGSGSWVKDGQSPLQALMAFQDEDGPFQVDYGQGLVDDLFATVQAIPAASGKPFPLPARLEAARKALMCLESLQDPTTGGWASFAGSPIDAGGTSRAIQAIAAVGEDPRSARWTTPSGIDAVEAMESLSPQYLSVGRGGRVGIIMQGVAAAGPPAAMDDFAGEDLPLLMSGYLSPTGEYDNTAFGIFAHAEAMLGLTKAEQSVDSTAIDFLLSSQTNGNWGDVDSTGIALQVVGHLSRSVPMGALETLRQAQTDDGGWGMSGATSPSTASEVVQGLVANRLNPFAPEWSVVREGRLINAVDAVISQQMPDGCWPNLFGPGSDPYSTTDAILLLTQEPGWGYSLVNLPFVTLGQ